VTTYRRFSFEWPGPWETGKYEAMRWELKSRCAEVWWFSDPEVAGEPFGRLTISFTVAARDQWWALQRAVRLNKFVMMRGGARMRDLPYPTWEKLAPHSNRGRHSSPE
jgi:hypothetical protein